VSAPAITAARESPGLGRDDLVSVTREDRSVAMVHRKVAPKGHRLFVAFVARLFAANASLQIHAPLAPRLKHLGGPHRRKGCRNPKEQAG
jgi:hypothetical protein